MRILVHDHAGHPFQAQLSRELARRGHEVTHAFRAKSGGRSGALERLPGDAPGLRFEPITGAVSDSKGRGALRRLRNELKYGDAAAAVLVDFRPDVVISANTPLLAQRRLLRASRRLGVPFVYWMQDHISASQIRRLHRRRAVIRVPATWAVRWLERSTLVGSAAVVAVTPGFEAPLLEYGVSRDRLNFIANWTPLDEIVPAIRANEWAAEHGLINRLVFLYAGSLGLKHDPQMLVELAAGLPDAVVVVVAEGAGADLVASEAVSRGLTNVVVLPSQPYDRLSQVLGTADVLVAVLDREAGTYSVPSKVLTYLSSERPILACVPRANLAAQVIVESGGGVVVEPADLEGWLGAARELARDEQLRGKLARNGRGYAERTFDIGRITDEFETIFADVTK